MEKTESYSIELNLYNGKNPFELNKFYSILFDTSKINLSTKQTEKLVDQFYKEMNIKRKDELMDDLFLTLIHKQFPNFSANTLFVQDIEKIDLDLKLSYDYDKIALGDNLIGFLNLDFYKFKDFFKFFCTFIFMYFSKIPKKQLNKIFTGFDENIIYIDSERPTHIVEKSLLKECAKQLYEIEKYYLIENQKSFMYKIRSRLNVGKNPKRHLVDPSLGCAILNITPEKLINDLETMGLYFEALCERDLKIYAESIGARLYHYRENDTGIEVDAIIEIGDGEYGAIEIKLGANKEEEAVASLKRFYELAEIKPKFMCVICGLYNAVVKRPDGIYVLPITALRP